MLVCPITEDFYFFEGGWIQRIIYNTVDFYTGH